MPTALAPGQLVDERYTLDHELHEDAFGTTWEAFDRGLGRRVCLRDVTFPGDGPHDARLRESLKTARSAIRVHHPGAVHVYDAFLDGDRLVIVTELAGMRSLEDVVTRKRPLAPKRVAAIGLELLEPLAAAHAIGVTHGSIEPSVVLMPDKARSRLSGFGVAPPFAGHGVQATQAADLALVEALGTQAYVAPEQIAGTGTTPATDLWSLGATLYFAAEGEDAFAADTPAATLAAIATDPPRPASRAGKLGPILERLLAKDPEERPTIDDLRRDLVEVAGIPLPSDGTAAVEARRRRWTRRRAVEDAPAPDELEVIEEGTGEVGAKVAGTEAATDDAPDQAAEAAAIPDDQHDWDAVITDSDRSDPWVEWSPDADAEVIIDGDDAQPASTVEAAEPAVAEVDDGVPDPAASTIDEEDEPEYRATPSWPPPQQRRSWFIVILCVWVIVVMAGLLVTNGQFFGSAANDEASAQNRPVLPTDPESVPRDWIAYQHPVVDFSISYPPGWRLREEGTLLMLTDAATGTELRVDARTPPGGDPEQAVLETERHFSVRHPETYRRQQMSPASYLDHPAALWEYTYVERGNTIRVAELDFTTKKYLFSMRFQATGAEWADMFPLFSGFLSSVRTPK